MDSKLLQDALDRMRGAYVANPLPSLDTRLGWLDALGTLLSEQREPLTQAISADYGQRSRQETWLAELLPLQLALRHTRSHLKRWMRPRHVATGWQFWPGRSHIQPQPLGVVGVISPWNYPLLLSLGPALEALAAGNRVMLKPSELTPRFSALLQQLIARYLPDDVMRVVPGDMEVGKAFSHLRFDHLFFTGSTRVGREVAQAAASHLTPVTLELGGKSPAIVSATAHLDRACDSLVTGKSLNAGQTCIAPDHLYVHEQHRNRFEAAFCAAFQRQYPTLNRNPDYSAIIAPAYFDRLMALRTDAVAQGARVVEASPTTGWPDPVRRLMAPALLFDTTSSMRVMQEEIFGPLLPVLFYRDLHEVISNIQQRDRPLALYWFGQDPVERQLVLDHTHAGGVTLNDCLLHIAQQELPFGGVGPSGHGAYHGAWGFNTFSKLKPVFSQSRWSGSGLLRPPYGRRFDLLQRWLSR